MAILGAVMAFGLVAEASSGTWPNVPAIGDLVAGWLLAVCGVIAWRRRPTSRVGPLLVAAAFAWFAGTFGSSGVPALAGVGSALLTIHRGPIVHAILAYPDGRIHAGSTRLIVIATYAYAALAPLARNDLVTVAVAAIVVATTLARYRVSRASMRQARLVALAAATSVAIGLLVGIVGRMAHAGPEMERAASWAYLACIGLAAVVLATDLSRARWARAELAELVVDLGGAPTAGIRRRLADALGDPSLIVAYWIPENGSYVDERGQPIDLPVPGSARGVTLLHQQGQPIGVLIHETSAIEDTALLRDVTAAASMALGNVKLKAQVRRHLGELENSRRRIAEATDKERRRLSTLVAHRVGGALADVGVLLDRGIQEATAAGSQAVSAHLKAARDGLESAEEDVERLAAGLHPAGLTEEGLGRALSALVAHAGMGVRINVPSVRLPPEVETAIVFVCSEALTNVRKYAQASHVVLQVLVDDEAVTVSVADDGVGGADSSRGSGLSGLRDRVAAIGGVLSVESRPGRGTRVMTRIPRGRRDPLADPMPGFDDEHARLAHSP